MTKHPIFDRSPKLRAAAKRLQLDCLDTLWAGEAARYRFVCTRGHVSLKVASSLSSLKKGCRECKIDEFTERLRAIAQEAGAVWLDPRWLGSHHMYSFRCQQGHTWKREGTGALGSCRCPHCVYERKPHPRGWNTYGWARLKQTAIARGGECLTLDCGTPWQPYSFRCAGGHTFQAKGYGVLRGTWCSACSRERKMQKGWLRLHEVCAFRGGLCLSSVYGGYHAQHRFRCGAGHEWETTCASVLWGLGVTDAVKRIKPASRLPWKPLKSWPGVMAEVVCLRPSSVQANPYNGCVPPVISGRHL